MNVWEICVIIFASIIGLSMVIAVLDEIFANANGKTGLIEKFMDFFLMIINKKKE